MNPALGNIQLKELTPRILQQYYPLVVTTEDDGLLLFDLIDFPDIDAEASNMAEGIASIKEQAQEAMLTLPVPPVPTPVEHIQLAANQFIVQIDV